MKESDVILAPLPQDDAELKYRPAIVLREMPIPYRDLLVCGVSTRLNQYIHGFDDIISPTDVDFTSSGLRSKSLIRLNFLAVIRAWDNREYFKGTTRTLVAEADHLSNECLKSILNSITLGLTQGEIMDIAFGRVHPSIAQLRTLLLFPKTVLGKVHRLVKNSQSR